MARSPDPVRPVTTLDGTDGASDPRQTTDILRSILTETQTLIRKEAELARIELVEAMSARLKAFAAAATGGLLALFAIGFLALALAHALDNVMTTWASRLVVGVLFLAITGAAFAFAKQRMQEPPLSPEETKRTVKEDVEWARAQLRK